MSIYDMYLDTWAEFSVTYEAHFLKRAPKEKIKKSWREESLEESKEASYVCSE